MPSLRSVVGLVLLSACVPASEDVGVASSSVDARTPLRINEIQVKATHNSYHVARLITSSSLRYTHAPLEDQLEDQGVRGFELDLHVDRDLAMRVFHTDHDDHTRCTTLADCLARIKTWSDAHPSHVPIFVMLEEKEIDADPAAFYEELDRQVLSVWPRERLVTPALVKGDAPTLRDAITSRGWPLLDDARGKLGLFLSSMSAERKAAYRSADDRIAFATGWVDEPDVGVLVIDDPLADQATLVDAVGRGYLVRTRADAAMKEVRDEDLDRFHAALGGGAHFISTDMPVPKFPHRGYRIEMPTARCNGIVGPSWCKCLADFDVEKMR